MADRPYCYRLQGTTPVPVDWDDYLRIPGPMSTPLFRTTAGPAFVSTVFLSIDHGDGVGPPVLFETMVFWEGHDLDQSQWRYTSYEAAMTGHAAVVAQVRAAQQ